MNTDGHSIIFIYFVDNITLGTRKATAINKSEVYQRSCLLAIFP